MKKPPFAAVDGAGPYEKRTATGLEGVLKEIFPIESYDKKI